MFDKYLKNQIHNKEKYNYNYLGISKKEFPRWEGWKIIADYKEKNQDIKEINDKTLDILVENLYYIKFINQLNSSK